MRKVILGFIWFFLDLTLKFLLGIAITLVIWLPFGFIGGFAIKPWITAGLIVGLFLNGLWELCDIFGLKRLLGIEDD